MERDRALYLLGDRYRTLRKLVTNCQRELEGWVPRAWPTAPLPEWVRDLEETENILDEWDRSEK